MAIYEAQRERKFPTWREIFPVYSLIVFISFTWTIYRLAWQLPSWLFLMSASRLLILSAYSLSIPLIESLAVLVFILFLALVFPARLLREKFVAKASALVIFMTLGALVLQFSPSALDNLSLTGLVILFLAIPVGLVLFMVLFASLVDRQKALSPLVNAITDRFTIFSFIYIPISLVGLIVVIVRNV